MSGGTPPHVSECVCVLCVCRQWEITMYYLVYNQREKKTVIGWRAEVTWELISASWWAFPGNPILFAHMSTFV
jgi:hypothetical protein